VTEPPLEAVELGALTEQDWEDLQDGEPEPFGPVGATLTWRPKDRHIAFIEITAPVWADQAEDRIEMPLAAMWRALREGVPAWPPGRVDVRGLPF
jgi:hypothetical protein